MPIRVLTIDQSQEWDSIIRSFPQYDVYWLSGYVKAFKIHGDGEPLLIYFDDEHLRGINVVMKRDIADDERFSKKIEKNEKFDIVTPYGYGGWLIDGFGDTSCLFAKYEKWCRVNNIVSEFVRYHPVLKNHEKTSTAYNIIALGGTIALDLSSPETVWNNLTSKNRNMIRKAQKSGIEIYNGRYPEIFERFRKIYNETMVKDNADLYYCFKEDFYKSVMKDLRAEAQIFYAMLEEKVIAASLILSTDGRLNYHLSGSIREYQGLAPNNLLLYEAALWGYANGCKTFHLGGGLGSCEDGLYKFKASFYRGEQCRFYIGKKVFLETEYKKLVEIRQNTDIKNSGFFPQYRA